LFSPTYALIEATLVVREESPYRSFSDIDMEGVRVCVTRNAAYDLHLARRLAHAKMVHASTPAKSLDLNGNHEASAGIKQALERFVS
ncbi:restriction endonuclease, partial [Pseudomonas syringae pv. tagetis]